MNIRAVVADPLGVALLFASAVVSAAMAYLPLLTAWSGRALWVLILGFGVYAYVAIAVMRSQSGSPRPLREIRVVRDAMARLYDDLKSNGRSSTRDVLVPVLGRALQRLDDEIMPAFERLLDWNRRLGGELDGYRSGKHPSPNAVILERLTALFDKQTQTIAESVRQVADAYATLLLLIHETDEPKVAYFAKVWRAEMEDIYSGISEVLGRSTPAPDTEAPIEDESPGTSSQVPEREAEPSTTGAKPHLTVVAAGEDAVGSEENRETQQRPLQGNNRQIPGGLTAREAEVLRLLCGGLTSKEIAAALVVSPTTAQRHIANIYSKIGVSRRHEAVTWALDNGLVRVADLKGPEDVA